MSHIGNPGGVEQKLTNNLKITLHGLRRNKDSGFIVGSAYKYIPRFEHAPTGGDSSDGSNIKPFHSRINPEMRQLSTRQFSRNHAPLTSRASSRFKSDNNTDSGIDSTEGFASPSKSCHLSSKLQSKGPTENEFTTNIPTETKEDDTSVTSQRSVRHSSADTGSNTQEPPILDSQSPRHHNGNAETLASGQEPHKAETNDDRFPEDTEDAVPKDDKPSGRNTPHETADTGIENVLTKENVIQDVNDNITCVQDEPQSSFSEKVEMSKNDEILANNIAGQVSEDNMASDHQTSSENQANNITEDTHRDNEVTQAQENNSFGEEHITPEVTDDTHRHPVLVDGANSSEAADDAASLVSKEVSLVNDDANDNSNRGDQQEGEHDGLGATTLLPRYNVD